MSGAKMEYRVVWKRDGLDVKRKRYVAKARAETFLAILTATEPWLLLREYQGRGPDSYECCAGHECGCGGQTIREFFAEKYGDQPALLWARMDTREVGDWRSAAEAVEEGK